MKDPNCEVHVHHMPDGTCSCVTCGDELEGLGNPDASPRVPDAPPVLDVLGGDLPHDICQDAVREATGDPDAELPATIREVGGNQAEEFSPDPDDRDHELLGHAITRVEYDLLAERGFNSESSGDGVREALADIRQQQDMYAAAAQPMLSSGYLGPDPALSEQAEHDISIEGAVRVLLRRVVYEDPEREGLQDTPRRVAAALSEMTNGYGEDVADILGTTFETDGYDEMVVLRDIDFTSLCEHHMLPFTGTAAVGYVPGARVVGLSKLARLVDCFAHRLQIQERMTKEIADAVMEVLQPQGVGVVVSAHHSCMGCRGVRKPGASMVTSCLQGVMRENPAARAEFLALAGVTK